jgi:asparagine synthase (glutamine-hydrolysing)
MCGILGTFATNPPPDLDRRLNAALKVLHHRGPDDQGLESLTAAGGTLALGHTRLSIIDLSPGGHQPMHSTDGRYTIVYNGEIYNYRELREELTGLGHVFRSNSDTEVLLNCWARWGTGCLPKLRGMFACVVFDRQSSTLTAVRDAFGIKPLYYYADEKGLGFASELSALLTVLAHKPALNLQRAYDYLIFGDYDSQQATFYSGIKHLLPGYFFSVRLADPARVATSRWWWPSIEERQDLSFNEATAQLREMFLQNIRLHLRSDVPLGAALSGGVDSSAVVCAMRHLEPDMPIHTFSFVARGSAVDEEHWADMVNAQVGAIPHKVIVSPHEMAEDLDDMIRTQGEPFGSTSIYAQYRVFRLAKEHGITVTLDGQGADEMLAGYSGYPSARMQSCLERLEIVRVMRLMWGWSRYPGRSKQQALAVLRSAMTSALLPRRLRQHAYSAMRCPKPPWLNYHCLSDAQVDLVPERPHYPPDESGRRLAQALRNALTGHGLACLLRHGDRNAMRWSIESRVPFLTHDLAEFLLRLPESYLLSPDGETKHVFRAAMRGIVPDAILNRRDKIGFQTPEGSWFKTIGPQLFAWIDAANQLPFLDAAACRAEVQALLRLGA